MAVSMITAVPMSATSARLAVSSATIAPVSMDGMLGSPDACRPSFIVVTFASADRLGVRPDRFEVFYLPQSDPGARPSRVGVSIPDVSSRTT